MLSKRLMDVISITFITLIIGLFVFLFKTDSELNIAVIELVISLIALIYGILIFILDLGFYEKKVTSVFELVLIVIFFHLDILFYLIIIRPKYKTKIKN